MHTRRVTFLLLEKMDELFHYRRCEQMYRLSHLRRGLRGIPSGTSGLRLLTPHTFQPRIHVIKGVNVSRRPPAVSVKTPLRHCLPERRHQPR